MKTRLVATLTNTGIVVGVLFAAFLLLVFLPSHKRSNASVKGVLLRPETWSGTITVKGDVFALPWAIIDVQPGTTVKFEKLPDISGTPWTKFADAFIKDRNDPTGREGYNTTHFDITATIKASGTKENPVTFTSAQAKPEYADWDQLVLLTGSELSYVNVAYSHNGINVDKSNVTIRNSTIHDNLWSCVDIYASNVTVENNTIYHCWHQAVGVKTKAGSNRVNTIQQNTIHDATLSVNCEGTAIPWVTQNRFSAAPIGENCLSLNAKMAEQNTVEERPFDTPGGTYGGQLIYPAQ